MNSHSQFTNTKVKELTITAMLGTLLFITQVMFAWIPNIELVSFLLILFTIHFDTKQVLLASYIFCLLEGLVFGFGLWWIMYLYVWQILILIVTLCKPIQSMVLWSIVAGAFGLFFGALCSVPYYFIGGIHMGITWWLSGLPFDLIHSVGNILVMLILYQPMNKLLLLLKNCKN